MNKSDDRYWEDVAQNNPYWGVLSHEKFKGQTLSAATEEDFFASGDDDIAYIVAQLRRLNPDFSPRRALDFGCGVGRLAIAMRSVAAEVAGVDVSPSMLKAAEANAKSRGVDAISFSTEIPEGRCDWVNSFIVFQHIQPSYGILLLKDLLEKLNDKASISLHFTIYRDSRVLFRGIQESKFGRYDGVSFINFDRAGIMEMPIYEYDLSQVICVLNQSGFGSLLVNHTDHSGSHGAHIFGVR
jgi:SAM-dependent methyltransferase